MLNYLFIYFGHGGGIWMWRKLDYIKLIIWFNFYFFGYGAFIVEPRWTLPINRSLPSKSLIHDCTLSLLCRSSYCLIHLCHSIVVPCMNSCSLLPLQHPSLLLLQYLNQVLYSTFLHSTFFHPYCIHLCWSLTGTTSESIATIQDCFTTLLLLHRAITFLLLHSTL